MAIYLVQLEAIPHNNNPEKAECIGAYVNCWVKADNMKIAFQTATEYVNNQGWEVVSLEDQFEVQRELYVGVDGKVEEELLDSLKSFDDAKIEGISAIYYTYSTEDEMEKTGTDCLH